MGEDCAFFRNVHRSFFTFYDPVLVFKIELIMLLYLVDLLLCVCVFCFVTKL